MRLYKYFTDVISLSLMINKQWELHIVIPLINLLKQDNSLQFIDIGSNFGVYSLTAASLGQQVVAVEAIEETCQRNYASIWLNKFQNQIILVQNALSDYRRNIKIKINAKNIGGSGVTDNANFKNDSLLTTMKSIYMDDLMEVITFHRAIMKIDIEGSEAKALKHADALFSQIDIPIVLFEWGFIQDERVTQGESIISFFMSKGYRAFSSIEAKEPDLKLKNYETWPIDIVWKKEPYLYA